MSLLLYGLSHHTANVELRELLSFSKNDLDSLLMKLVKKDITHSGFIISTCNRVEIYTLGNDAKEMLHQMDVFLNQWQGDHYHKVKPYFYIKEDEEAIRHLLRVACSLDSMVLGEPQILGQVKEAYFSAKKAQIIDPYFERLLQKTFFVAKKIRHHTGIGTSAVSISWAAISLSKRIFGQLNDLKVLIIGAGEMSELFAKHAKEQKVSKLYFANRSIEHAMELAQTIGGVAMGLDEVNEHLVDADLVVVSTGAPNYLISKEQIDKMNRQNRPMFLIDLSVPRNVDPRINDLENMYVYNIDDLHAITQENKTQREQEALKADAIIDQEASKIVRQLNMMQYSPLIQSVKNKWDEIKVTEMERLLKKHPHLSHEVVLTIDRSFDSLIDKMVQDPISYMKDDELGEYSKKDELLKRIFKIGE